MELDKFVTDFASCFEDTDISVFSSKTAFKELDEWDSLTTLAIMGMCSKKYGVNLSGGEIHNAETVEDIYNLVVSKK